MTDVLREPSWVRYAAAIVVAFIASLATGVVFALIGVSARTTFHSFRTLSVVFTVSFNLLIGFNGVFVGSLCLRQRERLLGAVGLLVLGICFEILMLGPAHGEFHFPRGAISTGIGGLLAVGFYLWRKAANNALERAAASRYCSDPRKAP